MKRILAVLMMGAMLAVIAPDIAQAQYGRSLHQHGNVWYTHYMYVGASHQRRRRHKRSFWKKHRDKLTVAGGALGGAALGGVIGGKKGAAIGAISGGGGAAVYTYGIRKRRHRRRY